METRRERLVRLRGARSHQDVATALSKLLRRTIGKGTVWKWEQSAEPNIELDVFFALAELYEVDARELATGERPSDDAMTPNIRSLADDYLAIDSDMRAPVRALIRKLAEQADNTKHAARKARDKSRKLREPETEGL